eukprot:COSAG02_NODE_46_length_45443_cov_36.731497_17_plen_156_part_00
MAISLYFFVIFLILIFVNLPPRLAREHLRLGRAAQQHNQALKRFKRIGNRSAGGTADSIGVKCIDSRVHSAFISTDHFFASCRTVLLYGGSQNVTEKHKQGRLSRRRGPPILHQEPAAHEIFCTYELRSPARTCRNFREQQFSCKEWAGRAVQKS